MSLSLSFFEVAPNKVLVASLKEFSLCSLKQVETKQVIIPIFKAQGCQSDTLILIFHNFM